MMIILGFVIKILNKAIFFVMNGLSWLASKLSLVSSPFYA